MSTRVAEPRESRGALAELPAREVRLDIQGLRAIAVLLVVGFHLYPDRIVGGFVGVDVFFVVSGFLITSHLLRVPPRSPRDFAAFWGRRIRRLLPASLLAIAVTVIAGCLLLPASQLANLGRDALASTLYVENWNLAASSVDYLGAADTPSPLQHYWSLGVEEQFYLVWPFLIALVAWLSRRRTSRTSTAAIVLGVFALASFVTSVIWTSVQPSAAYFVTPTRLWELAVGGLIAVFAGSALAQRRTGLLSDAVRAAAAWIGLALVAVSAFVLDSATPFPGWIAILPIGGAAMFLAADGDGARRSPSRLLGWRPVQFIGDTSYSIYLWHFPLIVLGAALLRTELSIVPKLVILVATMLLAWLTKRFVEDPVRTNGWLRRPEWRTYLLAAVATALVAALSFVPPLQANAIAAQAEAGRQSVIEKNGSCLGAGALVTAGCTPRGTGLIPSPATARQEDISTAYADDCFADKPFPEVKTCQYGDPETASATIALVGNSHGAQWLPALQEIAKTDDLAITTFLGSGCPPSVANVLFDTQQGSDGCRDWGQKVVQQTAGEFDLVVFSVASNSDIVGVEPSAKFGPQRDGYAGVLQQWADASQRVLVIRDSPIAGFNIPDCVAAHLDDTSACDGARAAWETPDPLVAAAEKVDSSDISVVDLSDHFCDADTCYAVLGGVLVYFDHMHVGATFSATLSPYLTPAVRKALSGVAG